MFHTATAPASCQQLQAGSCLFVLVAEGKEGVSHSQAARVAVPPPPFLMLCCVACWCQHGKCCSHQPTPPPHLSWHRGLTASSLLCAVIPHTVWFYELPAFSAHICTHLGCSVCALCDCAVRACQLTPPPPTRPPPSATPTRCVPSPPSLLFLSGLAAPVDFPPRCAHLLHASAARIPLSPLLLCRSALLEHGVCWWLLSVSYSGAVLIVRLPLPSPLLFGLPTMK